ncbi:MAG: cytochrome c, partial [Bryobacteraceae bacterium]
MRFAAFLLAVAPLVAASTPPTFYKDVLPVLQKNCQTCHRPGEAAPMSLLTYEQSRPWAKAIRTAVLQRSMPPWFADPAFGKFHNERRLNDAEIQTLTAWADAGAPAGKSKDAPKPVEFLEGWNIGKPDAVFEMAESFEVPASGT